MEEKNEKGNQTKKQSNNIINDILFNLKNEDSLIHENNDIFDSKEDTKNLTKNSESSLNSAKNGKKIQKAKKIFEEQKNNSKESKLKDINILDSLSQFTEDKISPTQISNLIKECQYAINESGNPFEIDKQQQSNKNKIIAYIIQKNDGKNYLIDRKGSILEKSDDDYYYYHDNDEIILIKDFDIQNPELRIFGHRRINTDIIKENNPMINNSNYSRNKYINIMGTYDNNLKEDLNEKKADNDFDQNMNIWRHRYGYNNNGSNSIIHEFASDKQLLINKTENILNNRLLKKQKHISKSNKSITPENSTYSGKLRKTNILLKKNYSFLGYKNPLLKRRKNQSSINITDNPLLNRNNIVSKDKNVTKLKRNQTLDYISTKYNYNKDGLYKNNNEIFNFNNKEREILLNNIEQKYKKVDCIHRNKFNETFLTEKIDERIKNYIIRNMRRNSDNKKINLTISILSEKANQAIQKFNKKFKEKIRQKKIEKLENEKNFYTDLQNKSIKIKQSYLNEINKAPKLYFEYSNYINEKNDLNKKRNTNINNNNKISLYRNEVYRRPSIKNDSSFFKDIKNS
jgi:hypothetical protein